MQLNLSLFFENNIENSFIFKIYYFKSDKKYNDFLDILKFGKRKKF